MLNNTTLADELNIDIKKENADLLDAAMDWLLQRFIEQRLVERPMRPWEFVSIRF
ncbi:MAG: hypothetical protein LBT05_12965 [Planctomycetaceae bacterium]|jgi:hypothetical protein|nr:hypothetical protein [Planctomycetaceae bacterium]